MTDKKKTEVNLEMCSGFFRIPTDDIIYNITVLASAEPSTTKVVEKIIEVEKIVEVEKKVLVPVEAPSPVMVSAAAPTPIIDDYYEKTARKFQQEIALAAHEAGATPPAAGGGSNLSAIQDLAAMAADLKGVLLSMKRHPILSGDDSPSPGGMALTPAFEQLSEKIAQAKDLATGSRGVPLPAAPAATKTVTRYLFNVDAVFQTIYELCTNETVKTHIQNARARADEIFDKNDFYDAISPKVSAYPEDDGFLNVPMTDIYSALSSACNDKAIVNLLLKMDKQQATIFLDQFLPLEVPPREEVTVAVKGGAAAPSQPADDGGLAALLDECQASLDHLITQSADLDGGPASACEELQNQVDDAINIAASIQADANRLSTNAEDPADAVSPLWLKIKALASLADTMLVRKETDSSLNFDDALLAGQAAAQRCLNEITPKPQAAAPPPPPKNEPVTKKATAADNYGEASQDDIDRLLEELG